MRFMILIKADKDTEAGVMPSEQLLADMGSATKSWPGPACCWRPRACIRAREGPALARTIRECTHQKPRRLQQALGREFMGRNDGARRRYRDRGAGDRPGGLSA